MADDDFAMMQKQGMLNDDRSVNLDHEEVRKIECGSATYIWGAFSPELDSHNGDFLRCVQRVLMYADFLATAASTTTSWPTTARTTRLSSSCGSCQSS